MMTTLEGARGVSSEWAALLAAHARAIDEYRGRSLAFDGEAFLFQLANDVRERCVVERLATFVCLLKSYAESAVD